MFDAKSSFLVFDPIARYVEHPRVVFSRTSAANYILFQNRQNHILYITSVFKFIILFLYPYPKWEKCDTLLRFEDKLF